jgi:hypothetical protein
LIKYGNYHLSRTQHAMLQSGTSGSNSHVPDRTCY